MCRFNGGKNSGHYPRTCLGKYFFLDTGGGDDCYRFKNSNKFIHKHSAPRCLTSQHENAAEKIDTKIRPQKIHPRPYNADFHYESEGQRKWKGGKKRTSQREKLEAKGQLEKRRLSDARRIHGNLV